MEGAVEESSGKDGEQTKPKENGRARGVERAGPSPFHQAGYIPSVPASPPFSALPRPLSLFPLALVILGNHFVSLWQSFEENVLLL